METLRTLILTIGVVLGIYLAVIASYLLVPALVFLFVFFVLRESSRLEEPK